jgi:Carboxypeptidase regulatory-like domain
MRFGPTRLLFPSLLLLVCLSTEMSSQTTTSGGLTGVVTDPSHAVVPNADIEIRDTAKGTVQSTTTDREGVYRFFFLAPGRYTLAVTRGSFRRESRAVNVLLGPPVSVNVALAVAQASATVTVTEEAPLVQAENGDVSTTMNQTQIAEVPNPGNDLTYIAQTTPGAVMNTDSQGNDGNFSILGMPGTSNRFTLNGMNDNENIINVGRTGALGLLLGQNQIQEATVVSIGYSGQFGDSAGANINYITKSGGNDFHGNAQYYWNGRVLNANSWLNKVLQEPAPRPFDIANQWAGSFGGPIKRNKLFFFFDSEGLRVLIPQQFLVVLPSLQFETATQAHIDSIFGSTSASHDFYKNIFDLYDATPGVSSALPGNFPKDDPTGCDGFTALGTDPTGVPIPCARHFSSQRGLPSRDTLTSGRVDWNASGTDRVFLQIQNDRGYLPSGVDPISSLFDVGRHVSWWQGQMAETHTFGSSAASQFLLAGSHFADVNALAHGAQALAAFPATLNFGNAPGGFTNMGGGNCCSAFPVGQSTTQYQISEDVVKIRAKHKFGFGAYFERTDSSDYGYTFRAAGLLSPQTLDAFYQGGVDPASPKTDFTALTKDFASQTSQRFAFYNLAIYGQDEWHARPNLTLTLALRAEHQSNPVCQRRCFARLAGPFESVSHDPSQPYKEAILINQKQALAGMDNILWSPRLSFAWQPLGVSHNTVVRAGIGVFYDPVLLYLARIFASNPPLLNSFTVAGDNLTPDEKTSLFNDAKASNKAFVQGFAANQTLAEIQKAIAGLSPTGFSPPGITVPDRRTHSPQYQRWSLELQQAFGADSSVSIGYAGHHGIHQLVFNPNANAFGFDSLPAGLCTSPPVPPCADPRFTGVTQITSVAVSNYNGVVLSFQHRFSRWTQGLFQASYTYGHAFDEVSNGGFNSFTSVSMQNPQDPNNLRGAYGPADYDVRHSFNASYVWEVPVKAAWRGRGPDFLVKGWQISGTIFARTGFPYTVLDFSKAGSLAPNNNYFGPIYAVPVRPLTGSGSSCGTGAEYPLAPHPCQPPQVFFNPDGTTTPNPNANFVQTNCETGFNTGTLPAASGPCNGRAVAFAQGRNQFRGPRYFNTDFTIMKNTKVPGWEKGVLSIGFQFFNLFNHPNFSFPFNNTSDSIFGQIAFPEQPPTGILGSSGGNISARMIQVKAQIQF